MTSELSKNLNEQLVETRKMMCTKNIQKRRQHNILSNANVIKVFQNLFHSPLMVEPGVTCNAISLTLIFKGATKSFKM